MSDTPRTDAHEQLVKGPNAWSPFDVGAVHGEFARFLEKELAEAKVMVDGLRHSADFHRDLGITLLDAKWLDPKCHRGCQSLVIRSEFAADKKLADFCRAYIAKQRISCAEAVCQTDRVIESAYEFIEGVCNIVGYHKDEDKTGDNL